MTQEKLARMSNVDVKTLYRAERGAAPMRPETLLDIATSLEVPIDELRAARTAADPAAPPERRARASERRCRNDSERYGVGAG